MTFDYRLRPGSRRHRRAATHAAHRHSTQMTRRSPRRVPAASALFAVLTTVMTWPQVQNLGTPRRRIRTFPSTCGAWSGSRMPSRPLPPHLSTPISSSRTRDVCVLRRDAGGRRRSVPARLGLRAPGPRPQPDAPRRDRDLGYRNVRPREVSDRIPWGRLVSGMVFAFAPYRFEHYMHMELQWTMWMPLAFLALHRTYDTGRWKYGLATGGFLALQMMSSIYYGISRHLARPRGGAAVPGGWKGCPGATRRCRSPGAGAGRRGRRALFAAVPSCPSGGRRQADHRGRYVQRPAARLSGRPEGNWLYGRQSRPGHPERRLFPGVIPVVMAITGRLLVTPSRRALVYLLLLVAAFDLSPGSGGSLYPLLRAHLSAYRSLRALPGSASSS